MFTAAVLTDKSADLLKKMMRESIDLEKEGFVLKTMAGQNLPHHMTINLGPFDETLNPRELLKANVLLGIDSLLYCPILGVCASPVVSQIVLDIPGHSTFQSMNSNPHITICVKPPAKPKASNDLFKKQDAITHRLYELHFLEATIQEC